MFARQLLNLYQNIMPFYLIPFRQTIGKHPVFKKYLDLLLQSESWSEDQCYAWQLEKLKNVLSHARKTVPWYMRSFQEAGFDPDGLKYIEELDVLPTIDKLDVKNNLEKFISSKAKNIGYDISYTGGSTGNPMHFFVDRERIYAEKAFFYYIWSRYGYRIGDRCIYLKGDKIADHEKHRYWKFDPIYNYMRFDSDYLNKQELLEYYDRKIKKFGAKVLFGFPSSIYQLAIMYDKSKLNIPSFDLILFASENTYDDQNEFISKIFKCKKIFFHYGHSEYASLAWKEFDSNRLGFVPLYGFTQLLSKEGLNVMQGQTGEITATGYSLSMPLIRYRTNDFAVKSDSSGQGYLKNCLMVESIEGRLQEFIVTKDKRLVSICTMGAAHFDDFSDLLETQYYQEKPGIVELRVTAKTALDDSKKEALASVVEKKLEHTVKVRVMQVDKIGHLKSNKKSMIDQILEISEYL